MHHSEDHRHNNIKVNLSINGGGIEADIVDGEEEGENVEVVDEGKNKCMAKDDSAIEYKAPRLSPGEIDMMKRGEMGFAHEFNKNLIVPYCLPLNRQLIVCHCGRMFDEKSGQTARLHILHCKGARQDRVEDSTESERIEERCKNDKNYLRRAGLDREGYRSSGLRFITYGSREFHELEANPTFSCTYVDGGHMCLRLHPETVLIACVCGEVIPYANSYKNHMEKCWYLQSVRRKEEFVARKTSSSQNFFDWNT